MIFNNNKLTLYCLLLPKDRSIIYYYLYGLPSGVVLCIQRVRNPWQLFRVFIAHLIPYFHDSCYSCELHST